MSRRCPVTQRGVMSGNNVSHAKNKTRRTFLPNLQQVSFFSDTLKRNIRLRLSTRGMRTIEFKGGIDAFVSTQKSSKLSPEMKRIRRQIQGAKASE